MRWISSNDQNQRAFWASLTLLAIKMAKLQYKPRIEKNNLKTSADTSNDLK